MAVRDLTLTLPGRESVGAQPNPTGVVVPSDGVAERAVRGALDPVAVRMRTVERLHRGTSTDRDPDTQARSGEAARLDRQRVRAKRAKERQ